MPASSTRLTRLRVCALSLGKWDPADTLLK